MKFQRLVQSSSRKQIRKQDFEISEWRIINPKFERWSLLVRRSVCQLKHRLASSCIHPDLEEFRFCNKLPRTLMYNHTAIIWNLRPREHSSLVERIAGRRKKRIRFFKGQAACSENQLIPVT